MGNKGADSSNPNCLLQVHPDPSIPTNPCPFNPDQGAAAVVACITHGRSGVYLSRVWACGERPVAMQGFTEAMQGEFYERSLHWVGLGGPTRVVPTKLCLRAYGRLCG